MKKAEIHTVKSIMKTVQKIFFTGLLFFSASNFFGQTGIYRTYDDYKNNKLERMEDWMSYLNTAGQVTLKFKSKKGKVKVKCREIWGFKYKGKLFRCHQTDNQPCRVISQGKVIYYENGIAHIMMIRTNSDSYSSNVGYYNYLSKSIDSEIIPIANFTLSTARSKIKEFRQKNPELASIIDCIEDENKLNNIGAQGCVKEFEKKQ